MGFWFLADAMAEDGYSYTYTYTFFLFNIIERLRFAFASLSRRHLLDHSRCKNKS